MVVVSKMNTMEHTRASQRMFISGDVWHVRIAIPPMKCTVQIWMRRIVMMDAKFHPVRPAIAVMLVNALIFFNIDYTEGM